MLRGGDTKAALVPGDSGRSLLIEAIGYANRDLQMPPKTRLPESVMADFKKWIDDGAVDPRVEESPKAANASASSSTIAGQNANDLLAATHWAFQPISRPKPPMPKARASTIGNVIDQFVAAKLEERNLRMAPEADRRTLIRRAAYDLTGLPPTREGIARFANDAKPDAFERMVESYLASPQYGERWGRWWLDVARYADSNGQDENKVMANAWRYRDWVVRSFNANQPFDVFVTEQLAGDLLPTAGAGEGAIFDRWTATGFLVLGPKMLAEQDKPKLMMDLVDEQIEVVSRSLLGLTVACARCHDHKFDPIPTKDYYALAGIFRSAKTMANLDFVSRPNERRITTTNHLAALEAYQKKFAALTNEVQIASDRADDFVIPREEADALEKALDALKATAPAPAAFALAVDEDKPVDLPVHIRGSHLNLAKDPTPRGFVRVAYRGETPAPPPDRSGRLELARWLTSRENPLTARVIVNRIWQAHFGEGLVRSSDNFGVRGETPSHPELLDWLASEFIRSGWNVKALHRLILSSAAWRQAGAGLGSTAFGDERIARGNLVDPDNRLLWHFPRQRLDAEMIRDALLAVSARLDPAIGGSLVAWKNDDYTPADTVSAGAVRRSIYLPVARDRVFDVFTIFDFANPSVSTAKRTPTVVSHQALFFLNSPLVKDSAKSFANNLIAAAPTSPQARVAMAYQTAFGRPPSESEIERALKFIGSAPSQVNDTKERDLAVWSAWCQTLFAANEFIYRE